MYQNYSTDSFMLMVSQIWQIDALLFIVINTLMIKFQNRQLDRLQQSQKIRTKFSYPTTFETLMKQSNIFIKLKSVMGDGLSIMVACL